MIHAHSLPGRPKSDWEPLARHLTEVGDLARAFGEPFGVAATAQAAGLLHDIGKASAAFQAYISGNGPSPDHSTAGAIEAVRLFGGDGLGKLLAYAIAGHHAGLADGAGDDGPVTNLAKRLANTSLPSYAGWQDHVAGLPSEANLDFPDLQGDAGSGFGLAFLTRMIFSCLVDADSLATRAFESGEAASASGATIRPEHRDKLSAHMAAFAGRTGDVNDLRAEVLAHAAAKAAMPPGPFTLTVPTGGGKTLASLSFALDHALRHGLHRVIYVIPFTSIIEQTAAVFRDALPGCDDDILEHHSSFDWEQARSTAAADDEGPDGLRKLERAAENWDAPIIVTTAVQFFESLFAARRGRCRKLHNLAKSVIILDEAQTMPLPLLRPCMAAIEQIYTNYGASVVLCTATQPALRNIDKALVSEQGEPIGLEIGADRELAPDPAGLYARLKRVSVEWRRNPVTDADIVERFAVQPQMLCIVNSRAHARDLFQTIRDQPGVRHLTTLMCAAHRRRVLVNVRVDLLAKRPVRLVSTSLIEAGVDVDFPEVWRAATGLDSIAQAAGRCNREGRLGELGRTVVFMPADRPMPRAFQPFWDAAREPLEAPEPLGLDAVRAYFTNLYYHRGPEALDATRIGGTRGILNAIRDRAPDLDFPFASIAAAFRMIDETMDPVIVPWDARAEDALDRLAHAERPPRDVLRTLQQYVVPIPTKDRAALIATGAAVTVGPNRNGNTFVRLPDLAMYDPMMGLQLLDRTAEANIVS